MKVEIIQTPERLAELEQSWHTLWSSLPDGTPFQSPDWLLPWCTHYCRESLLSFAFWRSSNLVGLAPMFIYRDQRKLRRLLLLGTGNSDYLDVTFDPRLRRDCSRLLISEIEKRATLWDESNLQRLRAWSPLLDGITTDGRLLSAVCSQEPCPVLDLRAGGLGATAMLRKAQHYAYRLGQRHSLSIDEATTASLDRFVEGLQRLHQARWKEKGMPGLLAQQNDQAFHREIARRFLAARMLKLYRLRLNGEIAAVLYGFQHRSRTYFYLSGFDPKYRRFSVGTILLGYSIERALEEKCDSFDFLMGRERYKYRWGANDQAVFAGTIRMRP